MLGLGQIHNVANPFADIAVSLCRRHTFANVIIFRQKAIQNRKQNSNQIVWLFPNLVNKMIKYIHLQCSCVFCYAIMFCNFAAIAAVLFEDRLGCLENEMDAEVQSFIKAVAQMFETGHQLMVFATLHKRLGTKVWKNTRRIVGHHIQNW